MSKKILYDHQAFQMQRFGGISRYFSELMHHIQHPFELTLRFSHNMYLRNLDVHKFAPIPTRLFKMFLKEFCKQNEKYSRHRLQQHQGIFHPTHYNPYFIEIPTKSKLVVTVHDMTHERFSRYFSRKDNTSANKKILVENADHIIAISEYTKNDLVELFDVDENRISVIYHGINSRDIEEVPFNKALPQNYLLYVGDRRNYKNFDLFLEAFEALAHDDASLQLICTGRAFQKDELIRFREMNLADRIYQKEVSDFELRQLYAQAQAFVYPSLYEGFGIPILEAFRESCPVALSRASCFPEIAGDAASYFDANSSDDMASTIYELISNKSLRAKLIDKGKKRVLNFSWEKTATQTDALYQKL